MLPNQGTKHEAADQEAGGDAKRRKEDVAIVNGSAPASTGEALAAGADKGDSDSSDDAVDSDIEKMISRAQQGRTMDDDSDSDAEGKAKAAKKPGDAAASDSDSSSSSSSTTSSSSSSSSSTSSEEEPAEQAMDEYSRMDEEEEAEGWEELTEEQRLEKDFETCQSAVLKRKEIVRMLQQLPLEEALRAIKRAWVRITLQVGVCVLAQVTDIVDVEPYSVDAGAPGGVSTVKVALRCRRCMPPERPYKIVYISNQDITKDEFLQWIKLVQHHGMELDHYRPTWTDKARDIREAMNFKFDENVVTNMLRRKKQSGVDVEFNAQKESRMRSEIQASISQMTLCGVKDNTLGELQQRERQARSSINLLNEKSAKLQEAWFDKRPNLFSLKEINVKNKMRQVARDKHALEFTYAMEAEADIALKNGKHVDSNPFERRPCRPVSAWDTKLTATEGLDGGKSMDGGKKSDKAAAGNAAGAKPAQPTPASTAPEGASTAGDEAKKAAAPRVDMRAHRHLWNMIVGDRRSADAGVASKSNEAMVSAKGKQSNGLTGH